MMGFVPDQEGLYQFTHTYYLPDNLDLSGEINLALELKELNFIGQGENSISEVYQDDVVFKVTMTGEELLANTNTIETDAVISTNLVDFSFEEIVLNPGYSRILIRASVANSDQMNFYDNTYKLKIETDTGDIAYFTQWNSPGPQDDGTHLMELRFDEMSSEISRTELLKSSTLDLQMLRYEGLKAAVEKIKEIGKPVTIDLE